MTLGVLTFCVIFQSFLIAAAFVLIHLAHRRIDKLEEKRDNEL